MMDGMDGMGGMMLWMTIWGVVGLALLVGLGVVVVRAVRPGSRASQVPWADSPEEILRRRGRAGRGRVLPP